MPVVEGLPVLQRTKHLGSSYGKERLALEHSGLDRRERTASLGSQAPPIKGAPQDRSLQRRCARCARCMWPPARQSPTCAAAPPAACLPLWRCQAATPGRVR